MVDIYKFVKWAVRPLDSLRNTDVYQLYVNRHNLNRYQKNRLFKQLISNSYSEKGVPLYGWMFPFNDVLKRFLVKFKNGGWQEYWSIDKTSIRANLTGIKEIIAA
jgi:hypothetical protein